MHKYNLKKYYFISECDTNLISKLNKSINIIYRNYNDKVDVYKILKFKDYCKKKGNKFFLSNNTKLAIKLKLDGSYLPSFNKNFNHLAYKLRKDFKLIGSAHNLKEIRIKEKQNVKFIFLSSIFKKNNNYLGINRFNLISNFTKKNIIALGGISNNNIRFIKLTNAVGIAGISYFKKKAPLRGPFYKYLKY